MFSLDEAQRLARSGSSHISIHNDGHAISVAGAGQRPAVAVVRALSDAVKHVNERGLIQGSVDRDQLWAASEFVVSSEVVLSLEEDIQNADAFYKAVQAMGFEWEVSPRSSDP